MKIRIISVGKLKEPFYSAGVQEYVKRLQPYVKLELLEGLEEKYTAKAGAEEIKRYLAKEAERVLKLISEDEIIVLLDINGQQLDSVQFAGQIQKWQQTGKARLNFVIGSAFGLSDLIKEKAAFNLSFSPLTFPHQMAVLITAEQIYRSFKIIKREPYHN